MRSCPKHKTIRLDKGVRDTSEFCLPLPRAFEDEKKARMGVVECAKHELLQPFNVLYEKEGKY